VKSFSQLPLLPSLLASLTEQHLTQPTDIQSQTLPALLSGKSLVGVAETGSGKTLAFVLPMLHHLKTLEAGGSAVSTAGRPRGLILVPGRELGDQVSRVFKGLTHGTRLRVRTALGGSRKQIARQNVGGKFEILVATPGRLVQLIDEGQLTLSDIRMLVFDEADQMLDPGFLPVARRIVADCPTETQLVMFSATMPQSLKTIVGQIFSIPPLQVRTRGSHHVVPTLTTDNRAVINGRRFEVLRRVLAESPSMGTLLFANTRKQCEKVAEWLDSEGVPHAVYMGQMDRRERRENLARFRKGDVSVLVATDLGGRGLDIERVERVVNVHLPMQIDNYLHRVGRTARAGRSGTVVNLVTERDQPLLAKLRNREERRG
jgi:superfamily II DNA/RNA helicase